LQHLHSVCTGWLLVNIGPAEVTRYVRQRQEAGATNGTINREIEVLGKMLRLAYKSGKLLRLPIVEKLKESGPRAGFFEPHQYEAVRCHLPVDLQVAASIAYTFGWPFERSRTRRKSPPPERMTSPSHASKALARGVPCVTCGHQARVHFVTQ